MNNNNSEYPENNLSIDQESAIVSIQGQTKDILDNNLYEKNPKLSLAQINIASLKNMRHHLAPDIEKCSIEDSADNNCRLIIERILHKNVKLTADKNSSTYVIIRKENGSLSRCYTNNSKIIDAINIHNQDMTEGYTIDLRNDDDELDDYYNTSTSNYKIANAVSKNYINDIITNNLSKEDALIIVYDKYTDTPKETETKKEDGIAISKKIGHFIINFPEMAHNTFNKVGKYLKKVGYEMLHGEDTDKDNDDDPRIE